MADPSSANMASDIPSVIRVKIDDKDYVIDKSHDGLIFTEDCKKIMKNLYKTDIPADFTASSADLTQPAFVTPEEKSLFFRMKMFYLLEERYSLLLKFGNGPADKQKEIDVCDAYSNNYSPFGGSSAVVEEPVKPIRRRRRKVRRDSGPTEATADPQAAAAAGSKKEKAQKGRADAEAKTGIAKFVESLRKADMSVHRTLEEKLLKTSEGKGLSALFPAELPATLIQMCMFPDYKNITSDGKDDDTRQNNLVTNVRTRIKIFDKMQSFYDTVREDNNACMFTIPMSEKCEMRDLITSLQPKRWHTLDEKKLDALFGEYEHDFTAAKTSLVADGTQPIVVHPSKIESLKLYVNEFCDLKQMAFPYQRETNFCFMYAPWKNEESHHEDSQGSKGIADA